MIDENRECPTADTLCVTITVSYNDSGIQKTTIAQACQGFVKWIINDDDERCKTTACFAVVESINCVSSENGVIKNGNLSCPSVDSYCTTITLNYNDTASGLAYINKRQGCENAIIWSANGKKFKCVMVGDFKYMDKKNPNIELGSAICCNTSLCNRDVSKAFVAVPKIAVDAPKIVVDAQKPEYNSATTNYPFIEFFVFLVSVPFFFV
uniref:UPAR/Ly6 domain-containing protein n=1 Tax=Panagrolaimus davidi TaxID=227884 RepID=A0A914QQU0_9BILA